MPGRGIPSLSSSAQKVFIVYNSKAGRGNQATDLRAALARHFMPPKWTSEIYETTGNEDISAICRRACEEGVSLVIAAGGDGTLVGVANGLVNSLVPLGILPMGTGNYLARTLLIPIDLEEALDLLDGDHAVQEIDGLKVGDRCFFTNVSVGISSGSVNDTKSTEKKNFGRLAYVMSMVKQASIFQLHRYKLTIDGRTQLILASEVLISNTTLLQKPPFLFGPPQSLGDGQLEIYVVTARNLGDYVRLAWDLFIRSGKSAAKLSHWTARQSVRIDALRSSPLVQGDGEVIGHAPVVIQLIPKIIRVVMPRQA
jgi:YegS/Rv2252/BmrU family lipid kinase